MHTMTTRLTMLSLALAAGLAAFPTRAEAQMRPSLGLVGGLDRAHVSYDPSPDFDLEGSNQPWLAVSLDVPLHEIVSVDARLTWMRTGVSAAVDGATVEAEIDHLSVPVLLRLRVPRPGVTAYGLIGMELGRKLRARSVETFDGVELEDPEFDAGLKGSNLSIDVGAGLEIPAGDRQVILELLYAHGVRNIAVEEVGGPGIRTRHLRLGVGIRF